ncbi:hypothetical protein GGR92_004824 [Spirosoma lacussanchae]|uniref:hypothetical protein n=1 Tax=Spirosoma lacussanchae TaxID=1884249 RepID=UPI001108F41A|nr:hypothetical protein [Spirosoma lacussanchae]
MFIASACLSIDDFKAGINQIEDHIELSRVRDVLRGFQHRGEKHPLDPQMGLAYWLLDQRAYALGFTKHSRGYSAPIRPRL